MAILPTYQLGTCMYINLSGGGGDAGSGRLNSTTLGCIPTSESCESKNLAWEKKMFLSQIFL